MTLAAISPRLDRRRPYAPPVDNDPFTTARQVTFRTIRDQAKAMVVDPSRMLAVHPAFDRADPEGAIQMAIARYREERESPRRWRGFGGETPLFNARAAWIVARWWRRQAWRMAR